MEETGGAGDTRSTPQGSNRPSLHFTPASGWINDPLGLTYRNGTYHLYFQHVPGQAEWAHSCHWGHATSTDLLHWTERPVALAPGDGDAGCWSGSVATAADDETVLFYTAVSAPPDFHIGRIRTARPATPALDVWDKDPRVAVELPADVAARTFRDPYVFAEDGRWWMLVGAGLADGTATALAWSSDDLVSWEYSGRIAERHRDDRDPLWTGAMWECPQLVRIGDRHVLVVSVWEADALHYVACAVGRFADGRFDIDSWHRLSWGDSYYAASAFRDRDGRPGLVFWLRGVHDVPLGWSGAISLPYLLTLDGDRPILTPHESLLAERGPQQPASAVEAVWRPAPRTDVLRMVDGSGAVVVTLRRYGDLLTVDADDEVLGELPYRGGELRVVLDGPVLEVTGAAGVLAVGVRGDYGTAGPECAAGEGGLAWWGLGVPG
jgi:beta-fructofuranosidase